MSEDRKNKAPEKDLKDIEWFADDSANAKIIAKVLSDMSDGSLYAKYGDSGSLLGDNDSGISYTPVVASDSVSYTRGNDGSGTDANDSYTISKSRGGGWTMTSRNSVLTDSGEVTVTRSRSSRNVIRPKTMSEVLSSLSKNGTGKGNGRPSRRMARLLDASGMEGFASGCFYEMTGSRKSFENNGFIEIVSPDGRPRMVSEEKVQILDVFEKKP